jgi:ATP-dependent DNA helicase RecQ
MPAPSPEAILKTVFGYDEFRPLQREVIHNVLERRDTLIIMPTGGGKSLCYQLPALILPGLTVVVSPLIALMKDQVEQLRELGVAAIFLNSTLTPQEYQENMTRVRSGEIKLLYVAPETLLTPRLLGLLDSVRLDCLAIDEAHCISEWGHDFRPEYRQLVAVRERFPGAVCLALTATATPRVRQDITATLGFQAANEFVGSFNRPNLRIEVQPKDDPVGQTLDFLKNHTDEPGIIYCFSRKQVDTLATLLANQGYAVRPYHAGLDDATRKANQEAFVRDDVQIIVATIAFGMGIDKPNVRFILHYDLPKSIESYYQEIGRAGRDGLPADCLLLYSYGDVSKQRYFINEKAGDERKVAIQHLKALTDYAESLDCRRIPLLAYFGEEYSGENCGMCDACLGENQPQEDVTIPAQKLMSCILRTGERYTAQYVAWVLIGSRRKAVLGNGHDQLSTYGIGQELTRMGWQHLARQLVQQGLLAEIDSYGGLKLTSEGRAALQNRTPIQGVLHAAPRKAARTAQAVGAIEHDAALFQILRALRKELADTAGVPPYVIFSDRTLVEMAAYYPQSEASLLRINGVGQVKLARYGAAFLGAITGYCLPRGLDERSPERQPAVRSTPRPARPALTARTHTIAAAFNAGRTLPELVEAEKVQLGTILEHLVKAAQAGIALRAGDDVLALSTVAPAQRRAALDAFTELGTQYLKPVFERLDGAVDYEQLKLLRLAALCNGQGD